MILFRQALKNNRTPVEIEIPFSPELSVENCVDAVKDILGISLDWTNYPDLGTSAGPSISLTIGRTAQGFAQKVKDLPLRKGDQLQFWITIVWKDKRRDDAKDVRIHSHFKLLRRLRRLSVFDETQRDVLSYAGRQQRTIKRSEELIETMIWNGIRTLKTA